MKQPKSYWFMKNSSKSLDLRTSSIKRKSFTSQINKPIVSEKSYETTVKQLQKTAQKVEKTAQKVLKMEEFYQLMCSGEYGKMAIRCYDHNNELIFYCVNDHKLLCANCMYSNRLAGPQKEMESNGVKKILQRLNKNKNSTKHTGHQVKQISRATQQIIKDSTTWQYEYKEEVNNMSLCKVQWEKLKQKYEEARKILLVELQKQYDKLQMQLSGLYVQAKKQLNDLSEPFAICLQKIINSYKTMSKLILPNRYPIPAVKQSWLALMKKNILNQISVRAEQIPTAWLKMYTSHSKIIIRKFGSQKISIDGQI